VAAASNRWGAAAIGGTIAGVVAGLAGGAALWLVRIERTRVVLALALVMPRVRSGRRDWRWPGRG
jgi:hypothetical protein